MLIAVTYATEHNVSNAVQFSAEVPKEFNIRGLLKLYNFSTKQSDAVSIAMVIAYRKDNRRSDTKISQKIKTPKR